MDTNTSIFLCISSNLSPSDRRLENEYVCHDVPSRWLLGAVHERNRYNGVEEQLRVSPVYWKCKTRGLGVVAHVTESGGEHTEGLADVPRVEGEVGWGEVVIEQFHSDLRRLHPKFLPDVQ